MIKRVIFDVLLILFVFIFPWWVSALMVFVGIFIFDNFYEFIIISSLVFSLYSVPSERMISSPIFFSLTIIISYVVIQYLKTNLILYKNN